MYKEKKNRHQYGSLALLLGLIALVGSMGCSDDNPAEPDGDDDCSHFDADGLILENEGELLLFQWEGTIEGEIELDEGEEIDVSVTFLTPDSSRAVPSANCEDQSLEILVGGEKITSVSNVGQSGSWSFRITGVEEGETTISVRILHADHPDFTSLDLPVHVHHEEEVEIEGFEIRAGSAVLVSQTEGVLAGEIVVIPNETVGPLNVVFLDAEGEEVEPEEGAALSWSAEDASVAMAVPDATEPFVFSLEGVSVGTTMISFDLLHKGHTDFESQDIPVRVEVLPSPEATLVREGRNPVAFWNYEPDRGPDQVHGGIVVDLGSTRTLTVGWLGPYDESQVNDKRPEFELPGADFEMVWALGDASVASALSVSGQAWSLNVDGSSVGNTEIRFELHRNGIPVLATGPIPIAVVDATTSAVQDHYLNLGGAWSVIVNDGQVTSAGCGRDANPGVVDLEVGELSALYKVTLLDEACKKTQLDSSYEYRFAVADPSVVRVLQTPVHWGEDQVFHVQGLTPGETTLTVYLFQNQTFQWKAPPYPVAVAPGRHEPVAIS